ncbi:MAG: hypothetical protein AAAC47_08645 [Pararhizobium sp.]
MRIDLMVDVERSIMDTVTMGDLKEAVMLSLSCLLQGNAKGVGLHPGMTIEWKVTRDDDEFAYHPVGDWKLYG